VCSTPGVWPPQRAPMANQDPPPQQPRLLGSQLISSGDPDTFDRRKVTQISGRAIRGRPAPGQAGPGTDVYVTDGNYGRVTPQFGAFDPQMFQTPLTRTSDVVSKGIMTNTHTGETFEVFENAMPPPTTTKGAINPDQLKKTNPRLVWLNGGKDPNAPLVSKKEICQKMPGPDGGPNVWGDQLYAGERLSRQTEMASRDIFNNRSGIYATDISLSGERPAGMVGLQPYYRERPYVPPTNQLDNKGWIGPVAEQTMNAMDREKVMGRVETRKPDLTVYPHTGLPDAFVGVQAPEVVGVVNPKPTWRGASTTLYNGPTSNDMAGSAVYTAPTDQARPTQKSLMSEQFMSGPAMVSSSDAAYVVNDWVARQTQKGLMTEQFAQHNAYGASQMGGSTYSAPTDQARPTQKTMMTEQFAAHGAYGAAQVGGTTYTAPTDQARATQKAMMAEQFAAYGAYTAAQAGGSTYTAPTDQARATQKSMMAEQFAAHGAGTTDGDQLPFQGEVNGTRREYYSGRTVIGGIGGSMSSEGNYMGGGAVDSHQYRGTFPTNYVFPSKTPEGGGGDTSSRWIGYDDHDHKREFSSWAGLPNATQDTGVNLTLPRLIPLVNPSCKRPDDPGMTQLNVRPTYFREV